MHTQLQKVLNERTLGELAIPSNLGYGKEIFTRGGVEIISKSDTEIEAWAGGLTGDVKSGGGSRRHVWLTVKDNTLHWHCSGNPKDHDIFCKHCVAVALSLQ